MLKVLVIADPESFLHALEEVLSPSYDLTLCHASDAGKAMLRMLPDGLIIDLPLCGTDGLSYLEEIRDHLPPVTLVLTNAITPYIETVFVQLGVGYVIRKPCKLSCVAHRIDDMFRKSQQPPSPPQDTLSAHLKRLGLRTDRLGTLHLRIAIPLFAPNRQQTLSKDIYPVITAQTGASADAIHAAIHSVIFSAWKKRDDALWRAYFPDTSQCPANREFIATMADYL